MYLGLGSNSSILDLGLSSKGLGKGEGVSLGEEIS